MENMDVGLIIGLWTKSQLIQKMELHVSCTKMSFCCEREISLQFCIKLVLLQTRLTCCNSPLLPEGKNCNKNITFQSKHLQVQMKAGKEGGVTQPDFFLVARGGISGHEPFRARFIGRR